MSGSDQSKVDAWRAEFYRSPELRCEFRSVEDYLAFKTAQSFGRFRYYRTEEEADRDRDAEALRRRAESAVPPGPVIPVERKVDTAERRQVLRLARIIERHLPPDPAGANPRTALKRSGQDKSAAMPRVELVDPRDWSDAVAIRSGARSEAALHRSWKPESVMADLSAITRKSKEILDLIEALPPLVLEQLLYSNGKSGEKAVNDLTIACSQHQLLRQNIERAKGRAREGEGLTKGNLRAVAVVLACSAIWERRTAESAPEEVKYPLPPFGRFVEAILDELQVGIMVRSAVRAASRFTANQKKEII